MNTTTDASWLHSTVTELNTVFNAANTTNSLVAVAVYPLADSQAARVLNYLGIFLTFCMRIFGTAANIVSIVVFSSRKLMVSPPSALFVSLSAADLVNSAFKLPLSGWRLCDQAKFFGDKMELPMDIYFKFWVISFGYCFISIGNWNTTALNIFRAISVCRPMQAKRWCSHARVRIATVAIIVANITLWLNSCFYFQLKHVPAKGGGTVLKVTGWMQSKWYEFVKIMLTTFVPWIISCVLTIIIIMKMREARGRIGGGTGAAGRATSEIAGSAFDGKPLEGSTRDKGSSSSSEDRITLVLIRISLLYLICTVPTAIRYIIRANVGTATWYNGKNSLGNLVLDRFSNFCISANSAVNIIFYMAHNPVFRAEAMRIFCAGGKWRMKWLGTSTNQPSSTAVVGVCVAPATTTQLDATAVVEQSRGSMDRLQQAGPKDRLYRHDGN